MVAIHACDRIVLEFEGHQAAFIDLANHTPASIAPLTGGSIAADELRGLAMTAFYARNIAGLVPFLVARCYDRCI